MIYSRFLPEFFDKIVNDDLDWAMSIQATAAPE